MVDNLVRALRDVGFDQYEIFHEENDEVTFVFRANRFYEKKIRHRQGFGVRVIKEKKIGFMSGTDINLLIDDIKDLKPLLDTRIELPEPGEYQRPVISSDKVGGWPEEQLQGYGERMIEDLIIIDPELKIEVEVGRKHQIVSIRNSNGINKNYEQLLSYLWAEAQLVRGDHIFWLFDFDNLSSGKDPSYQDSKDLFQMIIDGLRQDVKIKPGVYPTLIMPLPLSTLISGIGLGVSGKALEKGYSPLIDKVGEQVLSDKITIHDDGLLAYAFNSAPFDGEGIPKKKRSIFENGIFKGFIFDLETGVSNNCESTGNAQRSYASLPQPGINNLVITPGESDLRGTIGDISRGVLVISVVGGGHGNPYAGDFSVKLDLGFWIEKGEIVGKISDTMMAGNCYQMLNNVIEIGNEQKDLGDARLPWLLLSGLKFTTPQSDPPPR